MDHIARREILVEIAAEPAGVRARQRHAARIIGLDVLDPDDQRLIAHLSHHGHPPFLPEIDVASNIDLGKGGPPRGLLGQRLGRDGLARAAPAAQAAIMPLQRLAQRCGGRHLHVRIQCRADRIAAGEELLLAEIARQLAADLVGEVVARRQGALIGWEIAALHGADRLGAFRLVGGGVDMAVLEHLPQHEIAPREQPVAIAHGVVIRRRLGQRRQRRRLVRGEIRKRLVEVGLRRRSDAVRVLPEKDLVEVKLEDLLLAQRGLHAGGEDDLLDLAFRPAIAGEQEVLHHLLRDRRCTAHIPAARLHRLHRGGADAAQVVALMGVEILVLRRDEGLLDQVRDFGRGGVKAALLRELVDDLPLGRVDPRDRRRGVLREPLMAGQVAAIHPEHRADRDRHHHGTERQDREDAAEKR